MSLYQMDQSALQGWINLTISLTCLIIRESERSVESGRRSELSRDQGDHTIHTAAVSDSEVHMMAMQKEGVH